MRSKPNHLAVEEIRLVCKYSANRLPSTAANSSRSLANFKALAAKATASTAPGSTTGGSAGTGSAGTGSTTTGGTNTAGSNMVKVGSSLGLAAAAAVAMLL